MRYLILSFLFVSNSVFACPDLVGTYKCTGSAEETFEFQNFIHNGGFRSYLVDGYYILADGKTMMTFENQSSKELRTASCAGDALLYDSEMYIPNGRLLWKIERTFVKTFDRLDFHSRITNYDPQGRPSVDIYSYQCEQK